MRVLGDALEITADELQALVDNAAGGECMVPECFVIYADTANVFSPGGIGNIASHFGHYREVLQYIGRHDNVLDIGCGCGFATRLYRLKTKG
jgi:hypothetical protein